MRLAPTIFFAFTLGMALLAQAQPKPPADVPVVMLSDLHVNIFQDPAKFSLLNAAPANKWQAILAAPASATLAVDAAKLQAACPIRGEDTPPALLDSALAAARDASPHALFVTLSGDLLPHGFECRYRYFAPQASAADYSAFAAKMVEYITHALHATFGATPVYIALGNNDSGCADYQESSGSAFLHATAISRSLALPAHDRAAVVAGASRFGDFSAPLPAPIVRGRIIVLQDIFESRKYKPCGGGEVLGNRTPDEMKFAWLRTQLLTARKRHEQVWFMAHIPPGIDPYSTITKGTDICGGKPPQMYLNSDKLPALLAEFADVIRLAIFAHTHMDEIHLLHKDATADAGAEVAVKLVPAISPINGNEPSFLTAKVNPRTAVLSDYTVIAGSNQTGIATAWKPEYTFSSTYHAGAYTPLALAPILAAMVADKTSATDAVQAYECNFFVGDHSQLLQLAWPAYACSLTNSTAEDYRSCYCAAPAR